MFFKKFQFRSDDMVENLLSPKQVNKCSFDWVFQNFKEVPEIFLHPNFSC